MGLSSGDGGERVTERCWFLDTQVSALATEAQPSGFSWLRPARFPPGVSSNATSICPPLVLPPGLPPTI